MSQRLAEGPTLTLEHVERQNSGIYRCIADNGVREPVHIDMQLNVLCKFLLMRNFFLQIKLEIFCSVLWSNIQWELRFRHVKTYEKKIL